MVLVSFISPVITCSSAKTALVFSKFINEHFSLIMVFWDLNINRDKTFYGKICVFKQKDVLLIKRTFSDAGLEFFLL